MLALRGRNAAVLPNLPASCTSDGLDTRSARAHRANARAGPINPPADLAGQATRLGLEVIAKNPRQDFHQPGCQDGLRLTLTFLTERRIQIDRQYEYKYSVLILVFGNLIQQGRLTEQELEGLSQEKLDAIRRYAELNLRPD
jgi:hypothetical protein